MIVGKILRGIKTNPYAVLGIPSTSTKLEAKAAFYKLAKEYHPDVNSETQVFSIQEKFKSITQAYKEIISLENETISSNRKSQGFKYRQTYNQYKDHPGFRDFNNREKSFKKSKKTQYSESEEANIKLNIFFEVICVV
jgi:DnaJ-class molecular chaperone with C-terminal Zn finger domain